MYFTKMHGLGNDFIVFDNLEGKELNWVNIAKSCCSRHFGVGADGILIVEKSKTADVKMTIINSDGSMAEMCGNGIRCFCKYVYEKGIVKKSLMEVETLAGIMNAELKIDENTVAGIKINMGSPNFGKSAIPFSGDEDNLYYKVKAGDKEYSASTLLLGVPHTVIYTDKIDENEVVNQGKIIETLGLYPRKTNVNFVEVIDDETIKVRTWERGAGLTLACGTGTCACAVACYVNGKTGSKVKAILPGGNLYIDYSNGKNVTMEGPAEFICEGELYI